MDISRTEQAVWYKHNGYNCCMSVLMAYKDELGLDETMVRRLCVAFGSGMGGMDGTCGALVAAEMALGLKLYEGKPMHADARELYDTFKDMCGSAVCREIKGTDTGKMLCSCDDCIRNAVKILENKFTPNGGN